MKIGCKVVLFLLICLWSIGTNAQGIVKGIVVDPANVQTVLAGATVIVEGTALSTVTDFNGAFSIEVTQQKVVLVISYFGFTEKKVEVSFNGNPVADLGRIAMGPELKATNDNSSTDDLSDDAPEITLSESELEETDAAIGSISGILSSSRDRYQNTAGYQFGATRYRIKGFSSDQGMVTINNIPMNDPETGWTSFSIWGGLNDVIRYPVVVPGIGFSEQNYGNVGGLVSYSLRPSKVSEGGKITYSYGNRNYTHRAMVTYNSGLLKNGWAFSLSGSRRMASEGYIDGTFYDAWGYYLAVEKVINAKQSLSFVGFAAPRKYGRAAPTTQEAYDLAGSNYYNPNWGYQNGKKRNASVGKYDQPFLSISHYWKISEKSDLTTTIAAIFGPGGTTALNWVNGDDPRPDYYKNLPSYYTFTKNNYAKYEEVKNDWETDVNTRQVNWDKFYTTNRNRLETIENADNTPGNTVTGNRSNYIIQERRNDRKQLSVSSVFNKSQDNIIWNLGLNTTIYKSRQYAIVDDLLGGDFYLDIDKYIVGDSIPMEGQPYSDYANNDLNNKNNVVYKGEKFGYDYIANINNTYVFGQMIYNLTNIDFIFGAKLSYTSFWRTGKMLNPNHSDSYGDSRKQNFFDYALKGGIIYKINGRNYFGYNISLQTDAPPFRQSYQTARTSGTIVDNLKSKQIFSTDLSYNLRLPMLRLRLSGFYSTIKNEVSVRNVYSENRPSIAQELQKATGGFYGSYIWNGINKRLYGGELGLDYNITPSLEFNMAGGIGNYIYTNRPKIQVIPDNGNYRIEDKAYLKNYHVGGYPQSAAAVGMRYNGKSYWFAGFTVNYFADIYVDVSPEKHTYFSFENYTPDNPNWSKLANQEKLDNGMTVDLFAGKSWKIKDYRIALNANVSNIFNNTELAFLGFEQYRFDRDNPDRFQPKYLYMNGTQFFLNLNFRF